MSIIELSLLNDNNPINSLNPIIDLNTWQNELFATYLSQFGVSRIIVQVGLIPISDPQMMVWSLLQTIRWWDDEVINRVQKVACNLLVTQRSTFELFLELQRASQPYTSSAK